MTTRGSASRRAGVSIALLAALALAGCASGTTEASGTGSPAPTSASPTTDPSDAAPAASDAASEPPAAPEDTAGAYVEYTDGAIESTAGSKVLFFHASWCPQCRALDEQLQAEGAPDGLTVFKVDYDSRTDLRQKYGVTLQTTVVFVDDAGEAISSSVLYDDPSIESLLAARP
ncbi:thioredoxin [Agromyces sp. CFH 90414]|uniref:Thioredoxin n=1 Tax=Agromyces agglutinans TaxID=2662258 RepID=A0A6I2F926_9MICO|nr:thioredoxin family protein [Agromyces agglutinans]MRG60744.1 thioredoxin [Agromyces agglutinans]